MAPVAFVIRDKNKPLLLSMVRIRSVVFPIKGTRPVSLTGVVTKIDGRQRERAQRVKYGSNKLW